MSFNMKTHRKALREKTKKRREQIIPPQNEYSIKDLTPHNASRVMRGMNIKYK